jgi:hypothetical protein
LIKLYLELKYQEKTPENSFFFKIFSNFTFPREKGRFFLPLELAGP